MSSLLSKSFEALKITTPQHTGDSMRRRPFKLVRPKRQQMNPYTGLPHVQYYGYAVSPEWLIESAERHCLEALPSRNANDYEGTTITQAYELIRHLAGIYNLACNFFFNPKGHSVPPEWVAAMYELDT
ncbi:uncharacterized protein EDB91DRAFT_1341459 [Suillus paluster]|uniref:uncharacterized protein n=1 Tax=Suillus paluster TaxID=48578 RepID=UPI001B884EF2|nr:uncharacterized protein EDB91DRAFT_1341459 [Suillus paluster]KAG1718165.1 hypothetical protein EDB91DRAFT_1341459 [Suillus paluster]